MNESSGAELVLDDGTDSPRVGRNELGTVSIADSVVVKLAARAAAEHPDAGAAATRILGRALPGAGHLGTRGSDLDSLPRTSVEVDGSKAFISLQLSVRWPASVATVTQAVREHVRERVTAMTGLSVDEVHIVVLDLVTDIAPPPRVR